MLWSGFSIYYVVELQCAITFNGFAKIASEFLLLLRCLKDEDRKEEVINLIRTRFQGLDLTNIKKVINSDLENKLNVVTGEKIAVSGSRSNSPSIKSSTPDLQYKEEQWSHKVEDHIGWQIYFWLIQFNYPNLNMIFYIIFIFLRRSLY